MTLQDLYKQSQAQAARAAQQQRAQIEATKAVLLRSRKLMVANREALADRVRSSKIIAKAADMADK